MGDWLWATGGRQLATRHGHRTRPRLAETGGPRSRVVAPSARPCGPRASPASRRERLRDTARDAGQAGGIGVVREIPAGEAERHGT
jgi:hypothetical protein